MADRGSSLSLLERSTASSTWVERLFMNLLSYSIVLLPIAFIVIATRFRLFPKVISSSALVRWFVYGSIETSEHKESDTSDDNKLLLDEKGGRSSHDDGRHEQDRISTFFEFFWCLIGLQISYLVWGFLQEKIMTTHYLTNQPHNPGNTANPHLNVLSQTDGIRTVTFHDSQFLVFVNRLFAFVSAILALVYTRLRQSKIYSNRFLEHGRSTARALSIGTQATKPQAPLYKYIYCSLSNILSSWCQYEALKYVNFPTQCLSKSCKVIPVMLMSKLLMGKRYQVIDYFCAILLALGMFVFMLNQPVETHSRLSDSRSDSNLTKQDFALAKAIDGRSLLLSGLIMLALYLTFDSFTSNWQQSLYDRYDISNWQMMAAINFYSIFLTLTSLYQLGNLKPAFGLLASSNDLMRDCLIMSIMSSVGQMFVYHTIKRFGSVIFAVIMTLRQFISILLSCTIYKHNLSPGSIIGMMIVFSVVGFQVWHKSKRAGGSKQKSTVAVGAETFPRTNGKFVASRNEPKWSPINMS